MSMRYIIKRTKADDLSEIKAKIPDIETQLGSAAENLRHSASISHSHSQTSQYLFQTRKVTTGWVWVCPTIELVADDEKELFELTDLHGIAKPSHLAHL